jgi:hypothetical protein
MKGDGEGKMNAVEKQCVVHVCSRPAIVDSSQSLTLVGRYFLFNFKNLPNLYTSRLEGVSGRIARINAMAWRTW